MTSRETRRSQSPRSFPRKLAFAGLSLAIGTGLALGCGEVALRIIGYDGENERINSVFDPRYGKVRRNSWIFRMKLDPPEAELRTQRVAIPKPANEERVLFIGDSGTEGAFVRFVDSFPVRFGALMEARYPERQIRAVNAGVFGMTTLDELHFLQQILVLDPDVVVLGLFLSNDINFNLEHVERKRPIAAGVAGAWARLRNHSALAHFVHLRLRSLSASSASGLARSGWIPQEVRLVDRYGFHMLNYAAGEVALYMREPSPLVDRAYEILEQAMLHFQQLGKEHDFRSAVLLIPAPSAVAGKLRLLHFPLIYAYLESLGVEVEPSQLDIDLPRERVMAMCARLQMLCLDPTERFKEVGMEVFFPGNEHPTEIGHEILAELLAEHETSLLE